MHLGRAFVRLCCFGLPRSRPRQIHRASAPTLGDRRKVGEGLPLTWSGGNGPGDGSRASSTATGRSALARDRTGLSVRRHAYDRVRASVSSTIESNRGTKESEVFARARHQAAAPGDNETAWVPGKNHPSPANGNICRYPQAPGRGAYLAVERENFCHRPRLDMLTEVVRCRGAFAC